MSDRTVRISFEESDWGDSWIATAEGFRGIGATKDSAAHDVLMQIREAEMAAMRSSPSPSNPLTDSHSQ